MSSEGIIKRLATDREETKDITISKKVYDKLIEMCDVYDHSRTEDGISATINDMIDSMYDFESCLKIHPDIMVADVDKVFKDSSTMFFVERIINQEMIIPKHVLVRVNYNRDYTRTEVAMTHPKDGNTYCVVTINDLTLQLYISACYYPRYIYASKLLNADKYKDALKKHIIVTFMIRYIRECIKNFVKEGGCDA